MNDMIGDSNPTGGIVAAVLMMLWCPCVFLLLQYYLSFNPGTSVSDRIHSFSSIIHDKVWKHVLRLNTVGSSSTEGKVIMSDYTNNISETSSPLGTSWQSL